MTRPYDVLTIGDMCVDLVVEMGDVLPRFGQVEQWVPGYRLEMGGSNCLFACQVARLGLRVAVLGRVGDDDLGRLVLRRLVECGVDTRYVSVDGRLTTGLGVALCRPDGDRAILTCAGSLTAVQPEDVTDEFLAGGRHLHYGSYYLLTPLRPVVPDILRRARALGLTVSLDTNWDPDETWREGLAEALAQVNLFLPNEGEALAITGAMDVGAALDTLGRQVPTVAIKQGMVGALVRQHGRTHAVPVEPVAQPVDTIGAGDSFDAGFLAGWLHGLPPDVCAALGNRCGRATTLAAGGLQGQIGRDRVPELDGTTG
jgi:sugar/nucleoside kinase (ribokinase family)